MRTLQVFRRRSSLGSSSNSGATPHLLASPPSNVSAICALDLPPPAPPVAATSPRGALAQGTRRSTYSNNGGRTPPRPSTDNTISTRKSYGTCISQSETTQVATNVTTSAHRASEYERATKAAAAAMLDGAQDDDGGSTLSDDESDTISDLTALSAAYNSGAQTEVDGTDQANSTEMTREKAVKKPKSIFRRKLKYTKPQLSFGRSSGGSSRTPKAKGGGIPPSPLRKFRADMSALLNAPKTSHASQRHIQQMASPKTPKTEITEEASLDYSTDEAEPSPVEVHTPPHQTHDLVHPLARGNEHMSTPSAPTRPSSNDSSSSTSFSSSYSGDTFSTLTTKSSTNPSVKSAPAMACADSNTSMDDKQAIFHRRAKSQEQMDELFATILNITDAPGRGIEDMLKANKIVQSRATASSGTRRKKQASNINAIANIGFVEHEERARARESGAGGVLAPRFESYGAGAERKGEHQNARVTLHPPQLPMVPGDRRHRRLPSREEQMLAAPRMPLFPRNEPKVSRNKSIDSIEQGRQSLQFREERLCSFYSSGGNMDDGGRESSLDLFGDDGVPAGKPKQFGYEQEEERLDSEIYQTLLSMEAFDVKVEDIDDLSTGEDESEGSFVSSTSSSLGDLEH